MILYKLTDQKMRTYNGFQWELGRWYETSGEGGLCGPGWLHTYTHPLLAVLFNSIHAGIDNPRLFECEGDVGREDRGLKVGCTWLMLLKELSVPKITLIQRVTFGILCSLKVYREESYIRWAEAWLSGEDRSKAMAVAAAEAARGSWAAEEAAEAAVAMVAEEAKAAAKAAAMAARAATVAVATEAARAARAERIPLVELAERAIREEAA